MKLVGEFSSPVITQPSFKLTVHSFQGIVGLWQETKVEEFEKAALVFSEEFDSPS